MGTYTRFLYEFLAQFFAGLFTILGGIGKGMSPTLHTALEPMAFRGLLQDKEREVLHSGPGGGTYHLYEGGVQAVLGQYQGGRAGYRDGALAGTGAGVLRDGGRGERQET